MAAVKSTEPLILVQAGAGTGKSTLILGRIDYLIACGIKAEDITVLSFTNAAADNITAKNPNVHSMTIARMIHEIYTTNFANHELSQLNTLLNSLEIYYPNQFNTAGTTVAMFYKRIKDMISNTVNNFTDEQFHRRTLRRSHQYLRYHSSNFFGTGNYHLLPKNRLIHRTSKH